MQRIDRRRIAAAEHAARGARYGPATVESMAHMSDDELTRFICQQTGADKVTSKLIERLLAET